ncbi:MAG: (2Fe-2S)-binding protein [Chloroflexales bacterium]|nr:(2Fe-2S)-binding protein [Chloroflexales bacterium]
MATIIINDETVEGKVGERLLNVARRHGAHIGFICDNAGTCQGCRCQVMSGAEHLSPPSEAERAWLPAERLAAGQRLACQAIIRGHGEVRVLSRAEELRRIVQGVLRPGQGERRLTNLSPLLATLGQQAGDQLALFPQNVFRTLRRVGLRRFAFPILDGKRLSRDVARVREHHH